MPTAASSRTARATRFTRPILHPGAGGARGYSGSGETGREHEFQSEASTHFRSTRAFPRLSRLTITTRRCGVFRLPSSLGVGPSPRSQMSRVPPPNSSQATCVRLPHGQLHGRLDRGPVRASRGGKAVLRGRLDLLSTFAHPPSPEGLDQPATSGATGQRGVSPPARPRQRATRAAGRRGAPRRARGNGSRGTPDWNDPFVTLCSSGESPRPP
jgi:hypothetical protein